MKYYSAQELMERFRISRYSLYRAAQSGALPVAKKEGTQNFYREDDVINYIEQSSKGKVTSK